jgi:hypothetical protein
MASVHVFNAGSEAQKSRWMRKIVSGEAIKPPLKALCVVPQGMQEGTELLIEGREFGLVTGPQFVFSSTPIEANRAYSRHGSGPGVGSAVAAGDASIFDALRFKTHGLSYSRKMGFARRPR